MDIKKLAMGDRSEIQVIGRLDAYWAPQLGAALNDTVRQGSHEISLDLSEVEFMSSPGLGVLIGCYKQLRAIRGTLVISKASEHVVKLINLSGLKELLLKTTREANRRSCSSARLQVPETELQRACFRGVDLCCGGRYPWRPV
jgi:anti-sigma B factor antagonist